MPNRRGWTKWGLVAALIAALAAAADDLLNLDDMLFGRLLPWSVPVSILAVVAASNLAHWAERLQMRHEDALTDRRIRQVQEMDALAARVFPTYQFVCSLHKDGELEMSLFVARGNVNDCRRLLQLCDAANEVHAAGQLLGNLVGREYEIRRKCRRLLAASLIELGDIHSDRLEPDAAIRALTEAADIMGGVSPRSPQDDERLLVAVQPSYRAGSLRTLRGSRVGAREGRRDPAPAVRRRSRTGSDDARVRAGFPWHRLYVRRPTRGGG
jgi:hypothetical protein